MEHFSTTELCKLSSLALGSKPTLSSSPQALKTPISHEETDKPSSADPEAWSLAPANTLTFNLPPGLPNLVPANQGPAKEQPVGSAPFFTPPVSRRRMTVPSINSDVSTSSYSPSPTVHSPVNMSTMPMTPTLNPPSTSHKIRSPTDLLQAIQSDPQGTFIRIQALGLSNIELTAQVVSLKEKTGKALEYYKEQYGRMEEGYQCLLGVQSGKQMVLWTFIDQLKAEIDELHLAIQTARMEVSEVTEEKFDHLIEETLVLEAEEIGDVAETSEVNGCHEQKEYEREQERKRLDPNAQPFVPLTPRSFTKSEITETFSPPEERGFGSPVDSISTDQSFLPTQLPLSDALEPPPPIIPDAVLNLIIATLPPIFRSVCPESLLGASNCTVSNCTMKKLCRAYNDERPGKFCELRQCPAVHEYRTCLNTKCKGGRKSKSHARKRIHRGYCSAEEWRIRETIAGLRGAHTEGRYM